MNRKNLLCGIAAVMIAASAAWSVGRNSNESVVNDVALANVEALAFEDLVNKECPLCRYAPIYSKCSWPCDYKTSCSCPTGNKEMYCFSSDCC